MDSTMTRATLVAAVLVLVAALGALVSRPDSPLAQDDVEFEILGGTLISGSPGAGAGPVAQSDRVAARPPGSSGDSGQTGPSQFGPEGPPGQQPGGGPPGPPASPPGQPTVPPGRSFGIEGNVGAFYPGVDTLLTLTIHNPQAFAIEVTELTIEAFDAETCSASVVGFKPTYGATYDAWRVLTLRPAPPIEVESRSSEDYEVHITLDNDNVTDACQLAVFDLAYEGKAVRP